MSYFKAVAKLAGEVTYHGVDFDKDTATDLEITTALANTAGADHITVDMVRNVSTINNVDTITKLQFTEWCESNGKLTDLMNLLSSDSVLMFKWNAASYLAIDNPLVVASAPALGIADIQAVFNEVG